MTKTAGSGSISTRHGSADPDPDPDPPKNVRDPQHWFKVYKHYRGNAFAADFSLKVRWPTIPLPPLQPTFG